MAKLVYGLNQSLDGYVDHRAAERWRRYGQRHRARQRRCRSAAKYPLDAFRNVAAFINVFFSGILAGVEIVIHYGVRWPALVLDERSQLQLRQALILKLRVLVPAIFLPALAFGIAIAIRDAGATGVGFRIASLAALLIWIAIRVVGTVPINSATLTWDPIIDPAGSIVTGSSQ